MPTKIQARRGTAAAWTTANPVLAAAEPGFETDTGKWKFGDGTTAWTGLPYQGAASPVASDPWAAGPSGATMPRGMAINAAIPLTSGAMLAIGGLSAGYGIIPAGKTATHATVISGTTAGAGITHAWVALYRKDTGALLTVSNDLPTAVAGGAWAANTAVVFDFATPQSPTADLPVRMAIMVAATTTPSLTGANVLGKASGLSPVVAANVGTGLTTPATAPATITEPTPGTGGAAAGVWLT